MKLRQSALCGACVLAVTAATAAVPPTMQAIRYTGNGGPEVVKLETVPVPKAGPGQILVKVYAAGINPVDWKMRQGMGPPRGGKQAGGPPAKAPGAPKGGGMRVMLPGLDVAGVVAAVGPGVKDFQVGEPVMAAAHLSGGGYAQYVAISTTMGTRKPASLTYEQAAAIPTAGTTGLRFVEMAKVKPGDRVIVIGAAGGVGSAAVQIAKADGATVVTSAAARHNAYLKSIGADQTANYDVPNGNAALAGADVVINGVDGQADTAIGYLKKGGILVSPAGRADAAKCAAAGVTCPTGGPPTGGPTDAEMLQQIVVLVDQGKYAVTVEKSFPLAQAAAAQEFNRSGHAEGKVVLDVTPEATSK